MTGMKDISTSKSHFSAVAHRQFKADSENHNAKYVDMAMLSSICFPTKLALLGYHVKKSCSAIHQLVTHERNQITSVRLYTEPFANTIRGHLLYSVPITPVDGHLTAPCCSSRTVVALLNAYCWYVGYRQDLPIVEDLHLLAIRLHVVIGFALLHHFGQLRERRRAHAGLTFYFRSASPVCLIGWLAGVGRRHRRFVTRRLAAIIWSRS